MMFRLQIAIALGAIAFATSFESFSQHQSSIPVVGVLALANESRIDRLRKNLAELGHIEGRNFHLETRDAGDRYARLVEIANEYVQLKVSVIMAFGNTATVTASKATSTIPIVMVGAVDPVREKLAALLSHPGRNVTGVTSMGQEISPKRLELVKEAIPGLTRVGILWNPDSRGSTNSLAQTREAAKSLKLQLQIVEARSSEDFDTAFQALAKTRTNVFVLMPASMFLINRKPLLDSAVRHGVTGVYSSIEWDGRGVLFVYGADISDQDRAAARYIDKILRGAKPGDLPIQQPTKLELAVNLKEAKAFGIKLPQSILARADRVIE